MLCLWHLCYVLPCFSYYFNSWKKETLFAFFRNASPPLRCWFILSFSSYSERDYLPKATQHDVALGCKKGRCHNTPPAKSCRETRCATAPKHHSAFITDQLLLALHPGAVGRRRARWQLVLVLCIRGLCFRMSLLNIQNIKKKKYCLNF